MMQTLDREAQAALLRRLLSAHGRSLVHEPGRIRGLLSDEQPDMKLANRLLSETAKEGIPRQMLEAGAVDPAALRRWVRALTTQAGLHETYATWAILVWAGGLGIQTAPDGATLGLPIDGAPSGSWEDPPESPPAPRPTTAPAAAPRRGIHVAWLLLLAVLLAGAAVERHRLRAAIFPANARVRAAALSCEEPRPQDACPRGFPLARGDRVKALWETELAWIRIEYLTHGRWLPFLTAEGYVFRPQLTVEDNAASVRSGVVSVADRTRATLDGERGTAIEVSGGLPVAGEDGDSLCLRLSSGRLVWVPRQSATQLQRSRQPRGLGPCHRAPAPTSPSPVAMGWPATVSVPAHGPLRICPARTDATPATRCTESIELPDGTAVRILRRVGLGYYLIEYETSHGSPARATAYAAYVRPGPGAHPGTWPAVVAKGRNAAVYTTPALATGLLDLLPGQHPRAAGEVDGRPDLWVLYQPSGVLGYVRRRDVERLW